jgi:ATP-dependent DNA ligase
VKLYTITGADWSKRYPRIIAEAARFNQSAIIDAEVVCLDGKGTAQFDLLIVVSMMAMQSQSLLIC